MRIKILPKQNDESTKEQFKKMDDLIDQVKSSNKEIEKLNKENKKQKIAIIVSLTINILIGACYVYVLYK